MPSPPELIIQLLSLGSGDGAGGAPERPLRSDQSGRHLRCAHGGDRPGAEEALKDLFCALELRLADDFALGDWLELSDGRRGIVVGFSWRETRLRTVDDCLLRSELLLQIWYAVQRQGQSLSEPDMAEQASARGKTPSNS